MPDTLAAALLERCRDRILAAVGDIGGTSPASLALRHVKCGSATCR